MPILPLMYAEAMSVMVGGLEGATQHYTDMLKERDPVYSPGKLSETPTVHVKIGDAVSRCRTAGILMDALIRETIEIQTTRDINALSVHGFWDWHVCREQYGRGRVGLKPDYPSG